MKVTVTNITTGKSKIYSADEVNVTFDRIIILYPDNTKEIIHVPNGQFDFKFE